MIIRLLTLVSLLTITVTISSCQSKKVLTSDVSTIQTKSADYTIEGDFKILEVDKLGLVYLVNNSNEIIKLQDGKILFRYSSKRLGNITRLDVSNPQKVLVYYGDYYQIVFLDNTLSEIDQLDLDALGYWDVESVALSRDNFIWIYDPVNVKLIKISQNGNVQLSTNELFDIGFSADYSPNIMVDDEMVYLYDESELKAFNEYGSWVKTIPLENEGLQIINQGIIIMRANTLYLYPTDVQFKDNLQEIAKVDNLIQFRLAENVLHVIDGGGYRRSSIE